MAGKCGKCGSIDIDSFQDESSTNVTQVCNSCGSVEHLWQKCERCHRKVKPPREVCHTCKRDELEGMIDIFKDTFGEVFGGPAVDFNLDPDMDTEDINEFIQSLNDMQKVKEFIKTHFVPSVLDIHRANMYITDERGSFIDDLVGVSHGDSFIENNDMYRIITKWTNIKPTKSRGSDGISKEIQLINIIEETPEKCLSCLWFIFNDNPISMKSDGFAKCTNDKCSKVYKDRTGLLVQLIKSMLKIKV